MSIQQIEENDIQWTANNDNFASSETTGECIDFPQNFCFERYSSTSVKFVILRVQLRISYGTLF